MQSAEYYPEPMRFYGFRFAEKRFLNEAKVPVDLRFRQPDPSKLTDVNQAWLVWGTGRMAW